jgi:LmbE family N-acetylglucosaminyl deacetylase
MHWAVSPMILAAVNGPQPTMANSDGATIVLPPPRILHFMATVVAFHAHPDDEVVLTGGTLARAAASGHRVVVVVATDGRMGNENDGSRLDELRLSASILGVHRVECLGYADSGYGPIFHPDPPGRVRFGRAERDEAAQRLAVILRAEDAELLLSYQRNGGYGHRDHVQVHHVGRRAAELAATPRLLEVTMPRELLRRTTDLARLLRLPAPYDPEVVRTAYAPRATITHRIDVRRFARQKRDALAAHRSQITGRDARMFGVLLRLPPQASGLLFGREWFVDPEAPPGKVRRDIFDRDVPLPPWAGEHYVCPDCMLDYQTLDVGAAMGLIRQTPSEVRAMIEAVPSEKLRRRPGPGVWSVAEYACHLRDVYVAYTIRLYRARTEDQPGLEPMLNDLRAQRFRYNDADIEAVLNELRAAVDGCLDEATKFRLTDWQRVVMRRAGEQRTAMWLIRQAAHEGRHHLRDIARVGSPRPTRHS